MMCGERPVDVPPHDSGRKGHSETNTNYGTLSPRNKVLSQEDLEQELLSRRNMSHPELFVQPGEALRKPIADSPDEIAYAVPKDEFVDR
ncbi:MAG: hypothetical protein R3C53_28860 [Pirellulaceae bacterium]